MKPKHRPPLPKNPQTNFRPCPYTLRLAARMVRIGDGDEKIALRLDKLADEQPIIKVNKKIEDIELILELVKKHFDISATELLSSRRHYHTIPIRFIAYYLCHRLTGASWCMIGRAFNRHNSALINGYEKALVILRDHPPLAETARKVEEEFISMKS